MAYRKLLILIYEYNMIIIPRAEKYVGIRLTIHLMYILYISVYIRCNTSGINNFCLLVEFYNGNYYFN